MIQFLTVREDKIWCSSFYPLVVQYTLVAMLALIRTFVGFSGNTVDMSEECNRCLRDTADGSIVYETPQNHPWHCMSLRAECHVVAKPLSDGNVQSPQTVRCRFKFGATDPSLKITKIFKIFKIKVFVISKHLWCLKLLIACPLYMRMTWWLHHLHTSVCIQWLFHRPLGSPVLVGRLRKLLWKFDLLVTRMRRLRRLTHSYSTWPPRNVLYVRSGFTIYCELNWCNMCL